jgi:voltage-gated potassium channel
MYAISSLTTYVVGGEYRRYLRQVKVMQKVAKMENHVIICGFGRVGKQVAEDLVSRGEKFVIVELDKELIDEGKSRYNYLMVHGDSTNDETLSEANIKNARAVITCLPKDADNVYVVLAAREVKNNILIVSRASSNPAVSKLKMAGANNVIMPDSLGGSHMASLITNPDVMEFLDIIRVPGYKGVNIESISYDELPDSLKGASIEKLNSTKETEVSVIGFKGVDGEYVINPDQQCIIEPGTRLFVLGSEDQIKGWVQRFQVSHG